MLSSIVSKNKPVRLTVLRNKARHNVVVPLTPSCGFRIELGHASNVNAYSDGSRILITQGMMLFTKSDQELAYVIAKEMAHNVLDHAKSMNNTRAGIGPDRQPDSHQREPEAFDQRFHFEADVQEIRHRCRYPESGHGTAREL